MKYKLKIYTALFLICILTMTLLSGCSSPYDKITEEDEKTILFYVYVHPSPVHENDIFYATHEPEEEEERCVSYSGIRYMEGEAEFMHLGDDHTYTENSHAEEIVDFLETRSWREYTGIYW